LLVVIGMVAAMPGVIWYFVWPGTARSPLEVASMVATPSIAVLPFADMSPGKDQEYFSDEISPASRTAQTNRCVLDVLEEKRSEAMDHCTTLAPEEDRLSGKTMILQQWGPPLEAEQSLAAFVRRYGEEDF
jgi:hypothetical protein